MDLMDIGDISYVDVDELGVRPSNWIADGHDEELHESTPAYFGKDKLGDGHDGKPMTTDDDDVFRCDDEDQSTYEIDPETGEKIFCEVPVASSPPFALSNDKWIEEYLANIESSATSANQHIPSISPNSSLHLESLSYSNDPTGASWFPTYLSPDESIHNMMFPDQFLSASYTSNDSSNVLPHAASPIVIPVSNKRSSDSFTHLSSVSFDDEHSIGSHSTSSRRQRLFSSLESDSTTRDSEFTFDGSLIEAKLEKFEPDEQSMARMFVRRPSVRTNSQGQQDEDTLRHYHIPLTLYDITQSSTEEYNRHLARMSHLTPEQIHIIKDIRRRGKNKIAAQNCRKRKALNVETLLEEVDELKRVKHDLEERKKVYQQQIIETRTQYEYLHRQVLPDRQLPPAIIVK